MRGAIILGALCALASGTARAEACRGGPGDLHLTRVGAGSAPLFLAMAWHGLPRLERAVAVRCLHGSAPAPRSRRKDRSGR